MPDASPDGSRSSGTPTIAPFGDAAILISLGSALDPRLAVRAQAIAAAIGAARTDRPAIGRPVPAQASVLVPFDPLAIALEDVVGVAERAVAAAEATGAAGDHERADDGPIVSEPDAIEIPVRYGGVDGPDLPAVAELHGLRPADVIERHAAASYRVLFLGFAPGFAYLGGLPPALATPRRDSPRERIPAGTIGIAGEQTGIYPISMPGGWQLIGRTDVTLFDPARPDPALLRPGATVRFVPVADR